MTTSATNDRKLGNLYAHLTPHERARMLARLWREHNKRELDRLRETIPDATAGAAYNRALTTLRNLNSPMLLGGLAALRNGLEADVFALTYLFSRIAYRRTARAHLHRIWRLLSYPVTESEYRRLVELQRSELEPLDAYAEHLSDCDGTEPGLRAGIAALIQELPPDLQRIRVERTFGKAPPEASWREDVRRSHEIAARIRRVMDQAIKQGELPQPEYQDGEPCLPSGVLSDWGESTTPQTFEPYSPEYHIPALELCGGSSATWDVRPDAEAEAISARRKELRDIFTSILRDVGTLTEEDLAGVTLEPAMTLAEQERAHGDVQRLWPWATVEHDEFRVLAARSATRRAELNAYTDILDLLQAEDFGGEDPLAPEVRPFLEAAWQSARHVEALWSFLDGALKPVDGDKPWPPPLNDEAYYADVRPGLEQMFRGEYGE